MKTEEKNLIIVKTLINKMFELAGYNIKYEDILDRKDNWFQKYTMTEEQNKEWRKWGIEYLYKTKNHSKKWAEREISMLDLYCGLQIKNKNAKSNKKNIHNKT
jgi:hypothetical protein